MTPIFLSAPVTEVESQATLNAVPRHSKDHFPPTSVSGLRGPGAALLGVLNTEQRMAAGLPRLRA